MSAENVCDKNKFGFCRFRDTCRYKHNNTTCDDVYCEIYSCEKRHPRKCNYFQRYSRCKFGEFCKYSHVTLSKIGEKESTFENKFVMEITELKSKNDDLKKEIQLIKNDINSILKENRELKNALELLNNKKTEEQIVIQNADKNENDFAHSTVNTSEIGFNCDECGFMGKNKNGLKIHKTLKHKQIVQVDGNVDDDYENENNHILKAVFVAEDEVSAESELREFYISELISNYSEDIVLIEDESGDVYDGDDMFYNKRNYRKYTYIFKISDTYSWEEIKSRMYTDQVKELFII